jgi:hypothetical protein
MAKECGFAARNQSSMAMIPIVGNLVEEKV